MIEENQIKTYSSKEISKGQPGRPRIYQEGKKTIPIQIPISWEEEKIKSGQQWRYILRKGLDKVAGFQSEMETKYVELQQDNETLVRRFNNLMIRINDLNKELENLKKEK
jgi:hypothetical protein